MVLYTHLQLYTTTHMHNHDHHDWVRLAGGPGHWELLRDMANRGAARVRAKHFQWIQHKLGTGLKTHPTVNAHVNATKRRPYNPIS